MDALDLPGIGAAEFRASDGGYVVPAREIRCAGIAAEVMIDDAGADVSALAECLSNLYALDRSALDAATPALFAHYTAIREAIGEEEWFPQLTRDTIWEHVQFRPDGLFLTEEDGRWYVVWENECEWEPEHGLQLVFRNGAEITRISDYDGHPTHESAWGPDYEIPDGAVFWSPW